MSKALVSLSQFVLKVHSRCDLPCDYCYAYGALARAGAAVR
jgi:uncharacterized protein